MVPGRRHLGAVAVRLLWPPGLNPKPTVRGRRVSVSDRNCLAWPKGTASSCTVGAYFMRPEFWGKGYYR